MYRRISVICDKRHQLYHAVRTFEVDKNSGYKGVVVDLRSDTVTQPCPAMKAAMMSAELGDDVFKEDVAVNELEKKMADLVGKENALFVPSGSMGNLIAVLAHCSRRGSEVLLGDKSHIFLYEQGGIAQFGGIQAHILSTKINGTFCLDDLQMKVRHDDIHCPVTELVCIENTHNVCGGKVVPLQWINDLGELLKTRLANIPLHMDGARLFNASIASGESPKAILASCDSASICFSKGLGTPIGSVIVGTEQFIHKASRLRKALGGGMRQVGVLAGACIYALDNMVQRLSDDHTNAKLIAKALEDAKCASVTVSTSEVETNIILLQIDANMTTPDDFCTRLLMSNEEELQQLGTEIRVKANPHSSNQVRLVTHVDVTSQLVEAAIAKLVYVAREIDGKSKY